MTARSASGSPLHAFLQRPAVSFARVWLLPPLFAAAAVFAYMFMIVPQHARPWYTPPPPKPGKSVIFRSVNRSIQVTDDVTAKATRKAATIAPAPDVRKDTPARGAATASPPPTPAPEPDAEDDIGAAAPRTEAEHDALWERYAATPFAAEPTDAAWAKGQRGLLSQTVNMTRDAAFRGAPDAPTLALRGVECRSVRCEITLAGPYRHELDIMADALADLRWRGATLWRAVERRSVAPEPTSDDSDEAEAETLRLRLVVAFAADLPAPQDLSLGDAPLVRTGAPGVTGAASTARR
ncbi:MAG: hypothetical protein R3A79_24335 [Nannocystaceae bacterium]